MHLLLPFTSCPRQRIYTVTVPVDTSPVSDSLSDPVHTSFSPVMGNKVEDTTLSMPVSNSRLQLTQQSNTKSEDDIPAKHKKMSKLEIRLVFVIVLLSLFLVCLVVAIAVLTSLNRGAEVRASVAEEMLTAGTCMTEECIKSSARILQNIDRTVDPCDDFYEYACGNWIKRNPIPDTWAAWDQFRILVDELLRDLKGILEKNSTMNESFPVTQAKTLFRTCIDTDRLEDLGLEPMMRTMKNLNLTKEPPIEGSFQDWDWLATLANIQRNLGTGILIGFWISEDLMNTSRNTMVVDQVSPGFSERYLLDPKRFQKEIDAYRAYIEEMVETYEAHLWMNGSKSQMYKMDNSTAKEFANDIMNISIQLAKIMTPMEKRRDINNMYHMMKLEELQNITNGNVTVTGDKEELDWGKYLDILMEDTNVTLDLETDRILVLEKKYFHKLSELLKKTEPRSVVRYIWWRVFSAMASLTLQEFRDIGFKFQQRVYGLKQKTARWKSCTSNVNSNFGMAVSYLYVQKYFNNKSKEKALEMINDVRDTFKEIVKGLTWMDEITKNRTLDKAEAIRPFIGFPGWLLTPGELEEYYEGAEVVEGELFETYMRLSNVSVKRMIEDLRRKPERDRWISSATTVNAFYSPILNSITFPAGILQPPFYGLGLESLNYGAIGAIMGHELTHGFDDQGRRYDKDGNLNQWWSNATLEEYLKRVQCIIDQYSGFNVTEIGDNFTVNGINTQGENIADNGGLREALGAYKKFRDRKPIEPLLPGLAEFTQDQLFFLGFAHMWCGSFTKGYLKTRVVNAAHSPNKFRVIGTLSNSPEFSRAWKCPPGSPMNPDNKCVLW